MTHYIDKCGVCIEEVFVEPFCWVRWRWNSSDEVSPGSDAMRSTAARYLTRIQAVEARAQAREIAVATERGDDRDGVAIVYLRNTHVRESHSVKAEELDIPKSLRQCLLLSRVRLLLCDFSLISQRWSACRGGFTSGLAHGCPVVRPSPAWTPRQRRSAHAFTPVEIRVRVPTLRLESSRRS
jgi:hypothetical protein